MVNYTYQIVRESGRSLYKVSYRDESISVPLSYCFGHGETGQTYLLQHKEALYESRVSFYPAVERLDFTLGAPRTEPESLEAALGQKLTPEDARKCFSCHATNAVNETQELRLEGLMPGIGCEACHGPAAAHVAAAKAGQSPKTGVFSPANLAGDELSQRFCGSCHRSYEEVMRNARPRWRRQHSLSALSAGEEFLLLQRSKGPAHFLHRLSQPARSARP